MNWNLPLRWIIKEENQTEVLKPYRDWFSIAPEILWLGVLFSAVKMPEGNRELHDVGNLFIFENSYWDLIISYFSWFSLEEHLVKQENVSRKFRRSV